LDANDRAAIRHKLIEQRLALPNRLDLAAELQEVLSVWLLRRRETTIGAYWPIKGEFDPLPTLYRWGETHPHRRIGLPVVDKVAGSLNFHVWYPGCPTELDAYDIPKPKGTEVFEPEMLILPCVGYGPGGVRLGYGGGFYDRTVAALQPRPITVGLCYSNGFVPMLRGEPNDLPLDALITDDGVVWERY
jgi:5-formyltetrahydrofolate cyclo-ligase